MKADNIFPDNWREMIQGKKVILYNTGLGSFLHGREKRIEKMKWVFQVFKEHPDVLLWWRPHPLELSTVRSMIPELEARYIEMREKYQEEGVGILDESTDLNRAIAISDAYYGAWSSLVGLYKAAGKPVLYENQYILEWHKELFFDITDFVVIERKVWFLSSTMNILFEMSLDTFRVEEAIKIPYGNALEKYMSYRMVDAGKYLVLVPGCAKWIIRLDLEEKKFDKVKIGKYEVFTKFEAYAVYNEYIYMLPIFDNRIIKYDVIHNRVVCEKELRRENGTLFLEANIVVDGQYIYAVEGGQNCIYKYNMQNDTYEKKIIDENIQLFGIKKIENLFLLILANQKDILLWNEGENRTWKLEGIPEGYPIKDRPFCDFVDYKRDIYFFPLRSDKVFKLDTEKMVLEQYMGIEEKKEGENEAYFTRAKSVGDIILAFDYWNNQWTVVKPEEETVSKKNIIVPDEILDKIAGYSTVEEGDGFGQKERFYEEDKDFYSLHNYIKDVVRGKMMEQGIENTKPIGEKIYQTTISDVL